MNITSFIILPVFTIYIVYIGLILRTSGHLISSNFTLFLPHCIYKLPLDFTSYNLASSGSHYIISFILDKNWTVTYF